MFDYNLFQVDPNLQLTAWVLILLIIYHHVGYPILLKIIAGIKTEKDGLIPVHRNYSKSTLDDVLPNIHLFVAAYNEEACISQKIDSLAWLDYPREKLTVTILCDGCIDSTVESAFNAKQKFYNSELNLKIECYSENRGKIAMVNRAIESNMADIIAFSDVSAMLANDTLWLTARQFMHDSKLGVITGEYRLLKQGSVGEGAYWQYQNKVRALESELGAVMGAPGAYYAMRASLCQPLEIDTINDDFILPMRGVQQGYSAKYDPNIIIFETEATSLIQDAQRRIRISQGNMQQLLRLKGMLMPSLKGASFWASWMFLSGKFLRVATPYMLVLLLLLCAWLAPVHWVYSVLLIGQLFVYVIASTQQLGRFRRQVLNLVVHNRVSRLVGYLCQGHLMGLIGSAKYLQKHIHRSVQTILNKGDRKPDTKSW